MSEKIMANLPTIAGAVWFCLVTPACLEPRAIREINLGQTGPKISDPHSQGPGVNFRATGLTISDDREDGGDQEPSRRKHGCDSRDEAQFYEPLALEEEAEDGSGKPDVGAARMRKPVAGAAQFGENVVKIGLIATYQAANVILGAIPKAVADVNARPDLLPDAVLVYSAADVGTSKASEVNKLKRMTAMREQGVVGFISVDTECYADALAASAWNLPMITSMCADESVTDKNVYTTFLRTLSPSNKISKSVVALLREFGWNMVYLVVDQRPEFSQIAGAIESLSAASGIRIIGRTDFSDYRRFPSSELEAIIWKTLKNTRIYVFIGEHLALVDFMRYFHITGYLATGEYMVLSIDDAVYDPEGSKDQYMIVDYLDPFGGYANITKELMAPFEHLLKVAPTHTINDNYSRIAREMKQRAHAAPFCVPFHELISESWWMPLTAALAYDSVLLYAKAATEVLENGGDLKNGSEIMSRILGTWYDSVLGFQTKIDENGDAEGNYTVIALLEDPTASLGKSMQPVAHFLYNLSSHQTRSDNNLLPNFKYLDPMKQISWWKGAPPRAEPECGFDGSKCDHGANWSAVALGSLVGCIILIGVATLFRHYRYEQKLACLLWKIDAKDLVVLIPSDDEDFLENTIQADEEDANSGTNLNSETNFGNDSAETGGSRKCSNTRYAPSPTQSYDSALFLLDPDSRQDLSSICFAAQLSTPTNSRGPGTVPGRYRGELVAIKPLTRRSVDLTRAVRKELQTMRELRHDNIVPFLGACVDPGNVCIVTAYCARGSLEDILQERSLVLDNMFKASLLFDLIKGMIYLHGSEIGSHGNLKSSNCVVDSRWVLQITDFGLHEFRGSNLLEMNSVPARQLLWRAPEILRASPQARSSISADGAAKQGGNVWNTNPTMSGAGLLAASASTSPSGNLLAHALRMSIGSTSARAQEGATSPQGTQKGDVYSFGIILFEVIGRTGPYGSVLDSELTPEDIVDGVMRPMERESSSFAPERKQHHGTWPEELMRPPLDQLPADTAAEVRECMQECWAEDPSDRPDFRSIRMRLKPLQRGMKSNIFDNMLAIMEKYASNLEDLVKERTEALMEEKRITEMLLLRMLPKTVADCLKRGEQVEAESFDCVTIYFSDIVGFTELSASSTPLQVVDLLNDLYTLCDSIIGSYNVYKVETIGDAYMVVSGLPNRNGDNHAAEIASMALHLLSEIKCFKIRHRPGEQLKLRIGIHSGPCCAGVVGLRMPRYCLFGDTVNTASRMESSGYPLKIHVSSSTKEILDHLGGYMFEDRGLIPIKGKGEMRTYWLVDEEPTRSKRSRMLATAGTSSSSRRSMSLRLPTAHNGSISPHFNNFCLLQTRQIPSNKLPLSQLQHIPKHHLGGAGSEQLPGGVLPGFRLSRLPSMPSSITRSFHERRGSHSPCVTDGKLQVPGAKRSELFASHELLKPVNNLQSPVQQQKPPLSAKLLPSGGSDYWPPHSPHPMSRLPSRNASIDITDHHRFGAVSFIANSVNLGSMMTRSRSMGEAAENPLDTNNAGYLETHKLDLRSQGIEELCEDADEAESQIVAKNPMEGPLITLEHPLLPEKANSRVSLTENRGIGQEGPLIISALNPQKPDQEEKPGFSVQMTCLNPPPLDLKRSGRSFPNMASGKGVDVQKLSSTSSSP